MNFGDQIKQLRIKMNLTQEDVAVRCGLSKGFISQVERDLTSPSIATLVDILDCLGTNLKDFFNTKQNEKIVFSKEDTFSQSNAEQGYDISWLISNAQKNSMEPILVKIHTGGSTEEYSPYEGEVFGYVLSGSVFLYLGERKFKVKRGESFYYKANSPYYLKNAGKSEAVVVWVSTPPHF